MTSLIRSNILRSRKSQDKKMFLFRNDPGSPGILESAISRSTTEGGGSFLYHLTLHLKDLRHSLKKVPH